MWRSLHGTVAEPPPVSLFPGRKGGAGGPHRRFYVLLVAFGQIGNDLAVAWIKGRERLAACSGTELAVDQSPPRLDVYFRARLQLSFGHALFLPNCRGSIAQFAGLIDLFAQYLDSLLCRRGHGFDILRSLHLEPGIGPDVIDGNAREQSRKSRFERIRVEARLARLFPGVTVDEIGRAHV